MSTGEVISERKPPAAKALVGLVVFQGISGVVGGVMMFLDPTGTAYGFPAEWLDSIPFPDYTVPGAILFFPLGLAALLDGYGLVRRPLWRWARGLTAWSNQHWSWAGAVALGVALVAWIVVEVAILPGIGPIQVLYFLVGGLIVLLCFLRPVHSYYRLSSS